LKFAPELRVNPLVFDAAKVALGDELAHFRISLDGLHDLTTEAANGFNAQFPDFLQHQADGFGDGALHQQVDCASPRRADMG
jgi:hypothetical protein